MASRWCSGMRNLDDSSILDCNYPSKVVLCSWIIVLKGISIFSSLKGGLTISNPMSLNAINLTNNSYYRHHGRRTPRTRGPKQVKSLYKGINLTRKEIHCINIILVTTPLQSGSRTRPMIIVSCHICQYDLCSFN